MHGSPAEHARLQRINRVERKVWYIRTTTSPLQKQHKSVSISVNHVPLHIAQAVPFDCHLSLLVSGACKQHFLALALHPSTSILKLSRTRDRSTDDPSSSVKVNSIILDLAIVVAIRQLQKHHM